VSDAWPELSNRIRFDIKNSARVWNYWLGGNEHYQIDRDAGDQFLRYFPQMRTIALESRDFLARVVRYLAEEVGVRQFLDIGAGMPITPHTHEMAQTIAPDSKIVYVDNDPVVLTYARAWMNNTTPDGVIEYLDADVREPKQIIAGTRDILDYTQPIAILLIAVLGVSVPTATEMHSIIGELLAAVPPGSYLIVGDGIDTGDAQFRKACRRFGYHLRTLEEFRANFDGLDLIEPGLSLVHRWRKDAPDSYSEQKVNSYVGVGRKP